MLNNIFISSNLVHNLGKETLEINTLLQMKPKDLFFDQYSHTGYFIFSSYFGMKYTICYTYINLASMKSILQVIHQQSYHISFLKSSHCDLQMRYITFFFNDNLEMFIKQVINMKPFPLFRQTVHQIAIIKTEMGNSSFTIVLLL